MRPSMEVHHVPEMVPRQTAQVRDDGDEDAVDAFFIQRASQMVMIDQIVFALEAGDDRHHVCAKEFAQVLRGFLFPCVALLIDFVHAERHLGWPETQNRRCVKNRLARAGRHWHTPGWRYEGRWC